MLWFCNNVVHSMEYVNNCKICSIKAKKGPAVNNRWQKMTARPECNRYCMLCCVCSLLVWKWIICSLIKCSFPFVNRICCSMDVYCFINMLAVYVIPEVHTGMQIQSQIYKHTRRWQRDNKIFSCSCCGPSRDAAAFLYILQCIWGPVSSHCCQISTHTAASS